MSSFFWNYAMYSLRAVWRPTCHISDLTILACFHCPDGGTAAAVPPPFRPSEPALCGSCPLVTPYYCRLGDLLCFVFIVRLLFFCYWCTICVPSVLWYCWLGLLTCKNRLPYNLYCVGGDVKHCSLHSLSLSRCGIISTKTDLRPVSHSFGK